MGLTTQYALSMAQRMRIAEVVAHEVKTDFRKFPTRFPEISVRFPDFRFFQISGFQDFRISTNFRIFPLRFPEFVNKMSAFFHRSHTSGSVISSLCSGYAFFADLLFSVNISAGLFDGFDSIFDGFDTLFFDGFDSIF